MQIPHTPILCAPSDAIDTLGVTWLSADLIKGLQRINRDVFVPMPSAAPWSYPGKDFGHTCIYIGQPDAPKTRKVCAFHLGAIPEWTQIDPTGRIIVRGWRSILERCIKAGVGTRAQIERTFRISMQLGKPEEKWCFMCKRNDLKIRSTGGKSGMCESHEDAALHAGILHDRKNEQRYQRKTGKLAPGGQRVEPVKPKEGLFHDCHVQRK